MVQTGKTTPLPGSDTVLASHPHSTAAEASVFLCIFIFLGGSSSLPPSNFTAVLLSRDWKSVTVGILVMKDL